MRLRPGLGALLIVLFLPPCLWSQEGLEFFPVSQVRPGMKGVGRTVFEGDQIEEFQVELLGVLKNAMAPKHDIILARLSGGPLEKTGVIAGMSGSPVYVNGKLLGAVALSFPLAKEPIAGITPINEMLQVVPELPPAQGRTALDTSLRITKIPGSSSGFRLIPEEDNALPSWAKLSADAISGGDFSSLRLPLRFGGFSSEVIRAYAPIFRQMGFELMQGAALSGSENSTPQKMDLAPGSMISLMLVRGDLNLNVDCTVTYRKGDSLYACGHRFLLTGPAKIPFAPSRVLTVVPNLASSFKMDVPGPLAGSITQDRFGAIYGTVGDSAPRIPVHIHLDSTLNRTADYDFEIVQEPFLTPLLMNLATISTLGATERMVGPSTLELKGRIRLANGKAVEIEDVVSGDVNTPGVAGAAVSTPLSYLLASSFPDLRVEGVDLSVVSRNERRVATLEQVWSSKSEVSPGDHIELTAVLRTPSGETVIQKIPVEIPDSVSDKTLSLVVGGGSAINVFQIRFSALMSTPRDLSQLVQALNRMRRNNRLYALLMAPQRSFILQGEEYPSPPPSLVQTFLSDPAVSSSVTLSGTSIVGDFETKPTPYMIRGRRSFCSRLWNREARWLFQNRTSPGQESLERSIDEILEGLSRIVISPGQPAWRGQHGLLADRHVRRVPPGNPPRCFFEQGRRAHSCSRDGNSV